MHYGAFLRAINVGKHNRVKMDDLRAVCSSLGFSNVSTYLQTGNVAFEAADSEEAAASRLEEALLAIGLRNVAVVVRTPAALLELLDGEPFAKHDSALFTQLVTFFRGALPPGTELVLSAGSFAVVEVRRQEVLTAAGLGQSGAFDLNGYLERKFKVQATTRNWNVVQEFVARMCPAS